MMMMTMMSVNAHFAEEMKARLVRHAVELFLRPRRSSVSHLSEN